MHGAARAAVMVATATLAATAGAGPAGAGTTGPVVVARYTFDTVTAVGTVTDDSGHGHTLTASEGHGGKVKLAERLGGHAADFPARCEGKKCPHAVLQTPDAPELNPGAGPIRYGATVKLTKKDTGDGQNVVQKGYSASGSQYKLQVDGAAGHPSCVFSDDAVKAIHVAKADVSVSDGAWHRLECRRAADTVTILVDDVVHGTASIPAALAVTNTVPLSIGGKGNGNDNDQFHGTLDDVWIALG